MLMSSGKVLHRYCLQFNFFECQNRVPYQSIATAQMVFNFQI
jgi:hypothetical protein